MNQQVVWALGLLFFALVQCGQALQCWRCSSEFDVTCRDYFNLTRIQQNRRYFDNANYGNRQLQPVRNDPHLEHCDEMYTSTYNQKNVCLKRVIKGYNGIPVVNRECRLVSKNLKAGECPEELYDKSKTVEFCGTCETEGCNSATGIRLNILLATALPLFCVVLLGSRL